MNGKAYAKINLTLEVKGVMKNGFHEIKTIMCPIELHDYITIEKTESGILLIDNTTIPQEENFVYKAAKMFLERFKIKSGVRISLYKYIPSEAGLGGGSADCALTLNLLNQMFDLKASDEELRQMASLLGSDMTYCLYNRLSICQGKGDDVTFIDEDYSRYYVLLIKPPYGASTKDIYANYTWNKKDKEKYHRNVLTALKNNDLTMLMMNMFNDLLDPCLKVTPMLKELYDDINKNEEVFLSGSGTTLFILSKNENTLLALKKKYERLNTVILTKML
jgi:4-diphosphocytidyl-2-C-methyl-D-erythritol kinase